MNQLFARFRATLWWLVPLAGLLAVLGWEIDWGAEVRKRTPPDEALPPKPVATSLLPDYVIEGGLAARAETVNRTLFNPTRRPAPAALAEAAKPRMQRGLYTLTGTTLAGDKSLAFLKEVKGGKARTVKKGDNLDGVLVAEVSPDRVKLALGDESEELVLKVVTNPKATPAPAAPATAAAPAAPAATQPQGQAPPVAATGSDAAQTLAERRRAARAAAAAAAAQGDPALAPPAAVPQQAPAPPAPAVQSAPSGSATVDPAWQAMTDRYRQRAAATKK